MGKIVILHMIAITIGLAFLYSIAVGKPHTETWLEVRPNTGQALDVEHQRELRVSEDGSTAVGCIVNSPCEEE